MIWDVIIGFDLAVLAGFVLAGLLLNFTPGVDFLLITSTGIQSGPKIAMAAAVGINIGVFLHVAAAAAGLSVLLLTYPAAYTAIRYVGAAYLVWLAIQAWRNVGTIGRGQAELTVSSAIRRGFLTNILNPKTALFIFAFIPQFTNPTVGPIWAQMLVLGLIFLVVGFVFSMCLATAAGLLSGVLRSWVKILNKLTAILFGGLAVRLAFV